MVAGHETRTYHVKDCIAFRKTKEEFGGLSNMAAGFPIQLSDIQFLTAEALYQACRFPQYPDLQCAIIAEHSPMTAKSISRRYNSLTRPDWEEVRLIIMKWSLRAKLICNWNRFGELLSATEGKIIVEASNKDLFWGAAKRGERYIGINALGRLLMELREQYLQITDPVNVHLAPLSICDFLLLGRPIEPILYPGGINKKPPL